MNDIRTYIQSKLSEIIDVESGPPIPDSIVEEGKTYFGYELQEDFNSSDTDNNYVMQVSIIGRIVRKEDSTENTLEIVDEALNNIKEKLKETTVITIPHRIKTILNYDKVFVFEKGEIIEKGKPSELINNKKGIFYDLFTKSNI